MKITKKILSLLLVVLFTASGFAINASAATTTESETNDTYATADTIALNGTISGTLQSSSDVDMFKITATSNGKISLKFNHTYVDEYYGWRVCVICYSNGTYTELSNFVVNLRDSESITLPSIGATSTNIYYIKVADYGNTVNKKYTINTSFTTTDYYEKELNNSYASATTLKLNNSYGGNINKSDDIDYYKMTVSSNGKISLKFNHTYVDEYYGWRVCVYCYFNGIYTELSNFVVNLRDSESITIPSIGSVPSSVYYIKVSDYGNSVGVDYSIDAYFTSTEYFEKELNNGYSSATQIKTSSTYNGVINNSSDSDYYKLSPTTNEKISLKFNHTYSDQYYGWRINLYYYYNGTYTEILNKVINFRDSESLLLYDLDATSSKIYYIKVTDYGNTVGEEYSIVIGGSASVTNYTVTYNANGGNVSPSSSTVNAGFSVTLPTPTRSGYTCLGWSTSSTATSASYSCGAKYTPSKSVTLYAVWKQNPTTTYKVTYNANGGNVSPSSATVNAGSSVTLPTPTRSGYTCLGWSTSSTATSASYSCGAKYTPSKSITLYAVWKQNPTTTYKVTYNANGGSVSPSSSTVNAGSSVTLPTPTRSGYTCLGWSTSSTAASASYSCGAKYTPSKSITLYAVWKQNSTQIESITLNYKDNYYLGYYDFKPVKYFSDNAKVATVSESGEIYATGRGRTYVHAVDYYGNERVTEVNVNYAWWQWIIKIVIFGWIWY